MVYFLPYNYHNDTPLTLFDYDTLDFSIHGGAGGGQSPEVELYDSSEALIGNLLINDYIPGGTIGADTWYDVSIPVTDFSGTGLVVFCLFAKV